jgi:[1-hydroxy-2-(trimethylamino)ethyl]phosphonate dioxygenase
MDIINAIAELFEREGRAAYFGEAVSESEHALQAADLAARDGANDALVVAALLHDVGHLLHGLGENVAERGLDGRHEEVGHDWLARWFGPAVAEPVRLHVAAKRYLCATDPAYLDQLSPASLRSLELQGGPFSPSEIVTFERNPHHEAAVRLRHWDDAAKVAGLNVPPFDAYRPRMAKLLI